MPTDPNIIILPEVRLSFPHLFKPHAMPGSVREPQYQATFLLDNVKHATLITQIEKTIERVALDEFKKKVPLKHKALHDGNEKDDLEGYGDGVHFVVASRKNRPAVVDVDRTTPLAEADGKIYAGCYVHASIRFFAWSHPTGGRGVSAELRAVQFLKDGESFGAGPVNAEDEFADMPGENTTRKPSSNVDDF